MIVYPTQFLPLQGRTIADAYQHFFLRALAILTSRLMNGKAVKRGPLILLPGRVQYSVYYEHLGLKTGTRAT